MARKSRVFVSDIPQYVAFVTDEARGMFLQQEDFDFFIALVRELSHEYRLSIHAYVLLVHSFEFLATPFDEESLPKFVQVLARRYVVYFNSKYNRSGTLSKRRYTSLLVDSEEYLYDVIKYIETKALNLVDNEKRYIYSSSRANLLGIDDGIVRFREDFSAHSYKLNYRNYLTLERWEFVDNSVQRQSIIGGTRFINRVEELTGMDFRTQSRGRPKKDNFDKRNDMYKNLVVLDKEKHKSLKLSTLENLYFAKDMSSIPLIYSEVALVAKYFPVVFTSEDIPSLISLISLGQTNLAVNADGKWITEYIPAGIRKYPFAVVQNGTDIEKSIVLIDEDATILSKSKGKQLFKKSGESSDVLKHAIDFLSRYDAEMKKTRLLTEEIKKSGVLEEKEMAIGSGEERRVLLNGFCAVNEERLKKLDKKLLQKWESNGIMEIIKIHLESLKNVQNLFNLAKNRQV